MKIFFGNKRGFTLIELLIVIAVISLLSAIVLNSLNSARQKARNAERLSSIKTLINAFNLSLTNNNQFPDTGGAWTCVSVTCYEGWGVFDSAYPSGPAALNATVYAFLAPNLSQKPLDPVGGTRGNGGFLYRNPVDSPPTGLTAGAYLDFLIEPPGSCGMGVAVATNGNYINCYVKLD